MELQANKYFVYALIDPINNTPFYFGKGCGDRPYHHLDGRDKLNKDKHHMITVIRSLGHEPIVGFVQRDMFESDAYDLETFCINESRLRGLPITNRTGLLKPPSRKGKKMSLSARRKISEALKKRIRKPITEETRRKMRDSHLGLVRSDDFKKKVSLGLQKAWKEGKCRK